MDPNKSPYPLFQFDNELNIVTKTTNLLERDIRALESCGMEDSILIKHLINLKHYAIAKSRIMVETSNVIYSISENIDIVKNIDSLKRELENLRNIQKGETGGHAFSFMVLEAGNILFTY